VLANIVVVGDVNGTSFGTDRCWRGSYSLGGWAGCRLCPIGMEATAMGSTSCTPCKSDFSADKMGMAQCEKCGEGTNSTSNRTSCDISSCIFTHEKLVFNLTTLANHITVKASKEGTKSYEVSICNRVNEDSMCFDGFRNLLGTYVCGIQQNIAYGQGSQANVYFDANIGSTDRQLKIEYKKGSSCNTAESTSSLEERFTVITFECDPNIWGPNDGLSVVAETQCGLTLKWKNIASCRMCESTDYIKTTETCKKGKQLQSLTRVNDCNGPAIMNSERVNCQQTYPISLQIVMASLSVFMILMIIIVVIAIRNKKLHEKYELLVNESSTQRASGGVSENWVSKDEEKI